ncbi:MAG: hypothetical protein ACF8R7_05875 [Phycisphaerales bacterium JB039]
MKVPMGRLLVERGVLTEAQRDEILQRQGDRATPFGQLAEQMFGVSARVIEAVWAEQYASGAEWIDPRGRDIEPYVRDLVTRRQAWQFGIIPLGYDGPNIVACTTAGNLTRAIRFASASFGGACYFTLSREAEFAEALEQHYGVSRAMQESHEQRTKAGEAA